MHGEVERVVQQVMIVPHLPPQLHPYSYNMKQIINSMVLQGDCAIFTVLGIEEKLSHHSAV
jgi:hypothetical protein